MCRFEVCAYSVSHTCLLAKVTTRNLFMHHRTLGEPGQPRSPFDVVDGLGALRSCISSHRGDLELAQFRHI